MSRSGELGHLYHDSGINNEYTALDAKERLRTREINAREERILTDQTKVLDYAKRLTEKRHRFLSKRIKADLYDIKTRTKSLEGTKSTWQGTEGHQTGSNADSCKREKQTTPALLKNHCTLPLIEEGSLTESESGRNSNHRKKRKKNPGEIVLPKINGTPSVKFSTKHFQTRVLAIHRTLKSLEKARIECKKLRDTDSSLHNQPAGGAFKPPMMPSVTVTADDYEKTFVTNRQNAAFAHF